MKRASEEALFAVIAHPKALDLLGLSRADAGTRTPDPFITSEVLYQLSYVGMFPADRP
jgi:hypothetical protein